MSTVDKALEVLDLFSETRATLGLSETARLLDRDKATVQRHLASLHAKGFLEQDPLTRSYHLGPAVTRLAMVREKTYPVRTGVRNILAKLVEDSGETAHATHFQNGQLSEVAIVETAVKGVRVYIDPAEPLPLHATASGIAFLSAASDDVVERAAAEALSRFTPTTEVSGEALWANVRKARRQGYAVSASTFETDVVGIAAPLFDAGDAVCGAVAMAAPTSRFDAGVEARTARLVIRAAAMISRLYGARAAVAPPRAAE